MLLQNFPAMSATKFHQPRKTVVLVENRQEGASEPVAQAVNLIRFDKESPKESDKEVWNLE